MWLIFNKQTDKNQKLARKTDYSVEHIHTTEKGIVHINDG